VVIWWFGDDFGDDARVARVMLALLPLPIAAPSTNIIGPCQRRRMILTKTKTTLDESSGESSHLKRGKPV
jgi:hypothetical protein